MNTHGSKVFRLSARRPRPARHLLLSLALWALALSAPVCSDAMSQAQLSQNPELERLLAQAKAAEKDHRFLQAAALYRDFLKTHPSQPEVLQRLGLDYYLSSHFDEAIQPLSQALKLDP